MNLPNYVIQVLSRLEAQGYQAYLVGGCVRDWIMGRVPDDYDMTTNALPEQILAAFEGARTLTNGIAHGTVTVMQDSHPVEITTFRIDGGYADHRHPEQVAFTARIEQDLSRRDFTVNAMAYSVSANQIIDPFGGREDIACRLIRCVGEPSRRFAEDALRMLRAYRFASKLSFGIDAAAIATIVRMCDDMRYVARERIYAEMTKALIGPGAAQALVTARALCEAILQTRLHEAEWGMAIDSLPRVPAEDALRWAALLHNASAANGHVRAACAREILRGLHAPVKVAERAASAIANADQPLPRNRVEARKLLAKFGEAALSDAFTLKAARTPDSADECQHALGLIRDIVASGECVNLRGLRIAGDELHELGLEGREIGSALARLLDMVISGEVQNTPDALQAAASRLTDAPL